MPTNEEVWAAMGAQAALQVEVMAAAYEQSQVVGTAFIEQSANALLSASFAATRYADLAAAAWAYSTAGLPRSVLGLLPPPGEQQQLVKAMATIQAESLAIERGQERVEERKTAEAIKRVHRLANGNTMEKGRDSYQKALRSRGVESWKRVLSANPCDACRQLKAEEGDEVPMDVRIICHPYCRCAFVPSDPATRTFREHVQAESFQERKTFASGATFKSGLTFEAVEYPIGHKKYQPPRKRRGNRSW